MATYSSKVAAHLYGNRGRSPGNEWTVQAKVPYEKIISGEAISTDDLFDVSMVQSSEGEIFERRSSGWEDEYTLRISGFDEAKSRIAMDLENKRQQLDDVKDNLQNRIEALGNERQRIAQQRDDIFEQSKKHEEEKAQLNEKLSVANNVIAEQEQIIQELSPEDKPGDQRDGTDGSL